MMGAYSAQKLMARSRPNIAGHTFGLGDKAVTINGEPVTIRRKGYGSIPCRLCQVEIHEGDMHGRGPSYRAFCLDELDPLEGTDA